MKIGRIVIAGVVPTVLDAVVGAVTCGGVFNWVYQLEPTDVWKSMDAPPGPMVFVGILAINVILAVVYALLQKGIPGGNKAVKGLVFGLCVWAVGMLPGMFSTYAFMTVATTVVVYWTILGLIHIPLEGLIIALIYGR